MRILRPTILSISLLGSMVAEAGQGILASWDPTEIRQTLSQDASTTVPLTFQYDNSTVATVNYLIFIQDNSACPKSSSTHSWIPVSTISGSIPQGQSGQLLVNVDLNTTGLGIGLYQTNVCFVADDNPKNPTNVAVPVVLKSVSADVIFLDGFE